MVDVFAWQIDFFRITPGDNYNIVYTEEIIDGEVVGVNSIKAARFTHNKKPFFAFGYDQGLGNDFFELIVLNLKFKKIIKGISHKVLKILRDAADSTELSLN